MELRRLPILVAVVIAVSATGIPIAMAQQPGAAQNQSPPAATSFSEDELKTYAVAARDVQRIHESFQPKMQSAQSDEQRKAIQDDAIDEMIDAVRESGLSVETYSEIASAIRSDPEIANRVQSYMD